MKRNVESMIVESLVRWHVTGQNLILQSKTSETSKVSLGEFSRSWDMGMCSKLVK